MIKEYQVVSFNRDELRRYPGTGQEISRIINTLPSVASVGENRQGYDGKEVAQLKMVLSLIIFLFQVCHTLSRPMVDQMALLG